jgi:hypothetical protein
VKQLRIILGTLLPLAAAGLAVWVRTYRPDMRPAPVISVARTPAQIARGRYLAEHVTGCLGCHSHRDWSRFGGPVAGPLGTGGDCLSKEYGLPGTVCTPNLTPDRATGLGGWSDGEVMRAVREGVDREGNALFPFMPYVEYRSLSDEDARAIVAYLRTLPAVAHAVPDTEVGFPASFFVRMVPTPLGRPVPPPDRADRLAYGRYLTIVAGCRFCHTPTDSHGRPIPGRDFAGGQEFRGPWGTQRAPNLTPHRTGLAATGRDEFVGRFKAFEGADLAVPAEQRGRNTVMPWLEYAGMTREDLGAIYDYLRTLPPIANRVEVYPAPLQTAAR